MKENLPGVGDKINIDSLVANAGTIGWIPGASLLLTGLGWIDSLRASIRSMHELEAPPGNPVKQGLRRPQRTDRPRPDRAGGDRVTGVLSTLSKRIVDWADLDGELAGDVGT